MHAVATPDALALIEPGGARLTFAHLQNRIEAIAHAVTSARITRDDAVALVLPDGVGLMASFLGVASVAGCAVLNPALRPSEIESVLAGLEARAVIVDPTLSSQASDVARQRGISVLDVEPRTDGAAPPAAERANGHQVALLLQTSATTGKARIVPLTHSNVRAMAANTGGPLGLTHADRFLSMMPLFHLQGLMSSLAQLFAGGSVICTAGFEAGAFLSWLEEYRPTWYTAGPTLHHAILPLIASHPEILERSPLRFVRSIGAPLAPALLAHLECTLHAPVLEGYGMTEAGAITSNTPHRRKAGSAGRSAGSEIRIVSETGQILTPDCEGEIEVRGTAVMHWYRNDPEANRHAFHDGWLRTGDLGRLDAEGFLFVTGRIKEIINRGGEKILPGEIEEALVSHPAVAEAVAFGVAHPTLGEDVMAAAVLSPGASASESELRRFVSERIAHFKLPRRIIFLSAIPKGATGKPAREALSAHLRRDWIPFRKPASPERRSENPFLVTLQPHGSRIPFFCIPGGCENIYYFMDLAKRLGMDQPFFVVRDPRPLQDRGVYTVEEHAAHFCAAIRSMRPNGPYLLGGHCYGGILAFEVARQLVAAGQEVRLLVLFEVPAPGYPKVVRHWKQYLKQSAALVSSLKRGRTHAALAQVRTHTGVLKQLFGRKSRALTRRVLVSAGMQKLIEPFELNAFRNKYAGQAYAPKKLECDVVHFLAADERHSTLILDDPRLGWRAMAGCGFSAREVPGTADGIFKPPHVSKLASQLRAFLDLANLRVGAERSATQNKRIAE